MTAERANPFDDLGDFAPKTTPKSKPVERAQIERLAQDNGFPSRKATSIKPAVVASPPQGKLRRRYTTGRNQQLNIKATAVTIERFYRLADERHVTLGELLEYALAALEDARQT